MNYNSLIKEEVCIFFSTFKTLYIYVLSQKEVFVLLFCQPFFVEAPYILRALPSQTVFDFLPQRHNKFCHFISDIIVDVWTGEDQQQTNQFNTRLAVNPDL